MSAAKSCRQLTCRWLGGSGPIHRLYSLPPKKSHSHTRTAAWEHLALISALALIDRGHARLRNDRSLPPTTGLCAYAAGREVGLWTWIASSESSIAVSECSNSDGCIARQSKSSISRAEQISNSDFNLVT